VTLTACDKAPAGQWMELEEAREELEEQQQQP